MGLKFPTHRLSVANMSFPVNVLYCSDSSEFPSAIPLFLQFRESMPILNLYNQAFRFEDPWDTFLSGRFSDQNIIFLSNTQLFLLG